VVLPKIRGVIESRHTGAFALRMGCGQHVRSLPNLTSQKEMDFF